MRVINEDDMLYRKYMERMMHPRYLEPLLENENIDVDEFMEKYVESL